MSIISANLKKKLRRQRLVKPLARRSLLFLQILHLRLVHLPILLLRYPIILSTILLPIVQTQVEISKQLKIIGVGGNTVVVAADALDEKVANKEEMDEKKRSFLSFKKDGGSWYVYPQTVRVHFHIPALDPAFSADHSTNDQWICMCSGLCAVLDFRCRTQIVDVFRMDLRARVIAHVALEILSQVIKDGVVKTPAALQEAADAKQPVDLDQSIVSDKFPLPILPSKAKRPRDNDDESETSNIDKEDKMYEKMIDEVKHFLIAKKKLGIDIDPHTIVNVYKYWNKYGEDFPLLSPVAFYVLSIPPSSANIERLFFICAAMSHDNPWSRSALKFAVQLFFFFCFFFYFFFFFSLCFAFIFLYFIFFLELLVRENFSRIYSNQIVYFL